MVSKSPFHTRLFVNLVSHSGAKNLIFISTISRVTDPIFKCYNPAPCREYYKCHKSIQVIGNVSVTSTIQRIVHLVHKCYKQMARANVITAQMKVVRMLAHRLRRRHNIKTVLVQYIVFV